MRGTTVGFGAAMVCAMMLAGSPAWACGYGVPSPLARFTAAEWVVVGKITTYEVKDVEAFPAPGATAKQTYAIAVLEISSAIKSAEGMTHLRIALPPGQLLPTGQEACFFLSPHFEEAFAVMPGRFGIPIVKSGNAGFDAEVQRYERWGQLLKDPQEGLKSKDADERFLTAALLLTEYRTYRPGYHTKDRKTESIDPELSKLILQALAEANWSKAILDNTVTPRRLFAQLNPTAKDGWNPQNLASGKDLEMEMKKWLADNAASYRISTYLRN
jgi:hypothetical protein